ncbi:MAG TPA: outer membrane lipoprotein carrier protein LolA [Pyrinomonadaceae bacterium]|nr:outer membrane lipoprotein carrier protein LolA [Pyrinomonadaceae bacterium]
MKRVITPILALALLVVALVAVPVPRTDAQAGLVSSLYTRMQRNQQTLKSLSADISMVKYNSQIRDSDEFYGNVKYIPVGGKSAFVRLEWTKPQHEILAVANGAYVLYRPRLNMAYVGTTNSIKNGKDSDVLALLNMSTSQLKTRFGDLQDLRENEVLWGGVTTTHFKAVPKGAASYNYIEVWVDASGMPVQTKMVEKNNDSTTVRLTNVSKNQTIDKGIFELKLDSSVKKVKG